MRNPRVFVGSFVCTAAIVATIGAVQNVHAGEPTPLIPRDVLFGNPDRANVQLSPDGQRISFVRSVNGVLNVWVGPVEDPAAAEPVTDDTYRGIRSYFWAYTNRHILYVQDKGGDENYHLYSVDLRNNKSLDLTPFEDVRAMVQEVSHRYPKEILVGINNRDEKYHDLHRVNILTGEMELVQQNDEFAGFVTGDDLKVYFALKVSSDGGSEIHRTTGKDSWSLFTTIPQEDSLTTSPLGLDESRENLYMFESRGRNTAALTLMNIESGQSKVLAEDAKADMAGVLLHPTKNIIQAVQSTYIRRRWQILDKSIEKDFELLAKVADGDFFVTSRTQDDSQWIVAYLMDTGPVRYYLYDRGHKKAKFLFTNRAKLEGLKLAKMHPQVVKSRDGLNLVCYYTLPVWTDPDGDGRPDKPLPMVLFVHGGPWARDNWGFNSYHQWLSNRGYVVMSVNYRGSTGLGKNFTNAGDMEWAGKMHDDLLDAVDWATKNKIADKNKVAIMGGSYGGYATLVGLTFTPDVFACGVDIVGPSNLVTLLNSIPAYWAPMLDMMTARVGDHRTEAGKKFLEERSPLTRAHLIRKPLLIGQGANDPRVKQAESDQIVKAMNAKNIPVTYVLFSDEGHGFRRPENKLAFNGVTEAFLAKHLGGRHEPLEDTTGSTIAIPSGADGIPGLPANLRASSKTD